MALPNNASNNADTLLQLALSINPTKIDPFDTQQEEHALNHNLLHSNATEQCDKNPDLFSQRVPAIAFDPDSVDALIASEMAKLSVDDREKVYLDIHGVPSDYMTETPELIHLNLLELQNQIDLLPDKKAYNIAEKMDPDYVHDRDFRLAFLRCEKFDCPQAALRIIRHFQMKLDLFGVEKLVMHITQDDLDSDALDAHYACAGRFLEARDRGGRIINFMVTTATSFKTDPTLRKVFYHTNMVGLTDEEAQRHGAVCVLFQNVGVRGMSGKNRELNWKITKVNQASPMRLCAIHWCYSDEAWRESMAISKTAVSKSQQIRIRVYHGSIQQCLEELRGVGIDPRSIPIDCNGDITDLEEARQRWEAQRRYERLNFPLRSTFYVPFSQDVLLGKGTPFQVHPGNKRFRELISAHIKQYDKAQRAEKRTIALHIIDTIKQSGGLFLKQDGGKWSRVNDDVARLKVTAAFRTLRQLHR